MNRARPFLGMMAAVIIASAAISPSQSENAAQTPPFKAHVDLQTFMEHVLSPAAAVIWRSNAIVIDKDGEHDLSPKTDEDWEKLVTGTATLAEATNALMIPERVRDQAWNPYVQKLAEAANKAYRAAEEHDLKSIWEVSDQLDGICAACHRHYGVE
jgi:hypothetical protein